MPLSPASTWSTCRHHTVCVAFCFVCKLNEAVEYTPGDWMFPLALINPGHPCHFVVIFHFGKLD